MPQAMPSWFAADRVYRGPEGWYIGSPKSFRVGPYPRQAAAEARSREITEELQRCSNVGEVVRTVRSFLYSQNSQNSQNSQTTDEGTPAASGAPLPPAAASGRAKPPAVVMGSIGVPPIRTGEDAGVWFRTNRYFAVGEAWFFATRENVDVGPYDSKEAAERDAESLLRILRDRATESQRRLAVQQFKIRPQTQAAG